jgi:rhodanese-related sulfurtransferase
MPATGSPRISLVTEKEALSPEEAACHLRRKLAMETDPADVHADLAKGHTHLVLVDTRAEGDYAREHVPGAISLPTRRIDGERTAGLDRDALYVTYCWGPGCNGSTKGALRLAELGLRVKEMIGGIEYWKREGYPTETSG